MKISLIGLSGCGKTSLYSVIFAEKTPEDILTGRKLPACNLAITGIFKGFSWLCWFVDRLTCDSEICGYIHSMQTIADKKFFVNNIFFKYVANPHVTMANDFMGKEGSITIRTRIEIKEILQKLAQKGYRTLSQQCEMILIEWLKEKGHLKEDQE